MEEEYLPVRLRSSGLVLRFSGSSETKVKKIIRFVIMLKNMILCELENFKGIKKYKVVIFQENFKASYIDSKKFIKFQKNCKISRELNNFKRIV